MVQRRLQRARGHHLLVLSVFSILACFVQPVMNAKKDGRRDWSHGRTRQIALFASTFAGSTEGWGLEAEAPGSMSTAQLQAGDRYLVVSDSGPDIWYFTTPHDWGGDRSAAYNGEIIFKFWHPVQPPAGTNPASPVKVKHTTDVIIETTCGFSVRLRDFFPSARGAMAVYSVPMSEDAASWIDSRTHTRITQLDFLVALSHLRAIKLRGGFLRGPETVHLADFRIVPPAKGMITREQLEPCCSPDGRMAACQRKGTKIVGQSHQHHPEGLTPPGLEFECGGSLVTPKSRPRVRFVHPKSSRRSGGARITVYGENFGLSGKSYMRVAGRKSKPCYIPKAQHCVNGILDFDEQNVDCGGKHCPSCTYLAPHCSNGILDFDEDKTDCGGKDCAQCLPMTFVEHCTNGIRDEDEVAIDIGGQDCLPTFCFDSRIQGDKRDRENNCGGSCPPCFPRSYAEPDRQQSQVAVCETPIGSNQKDAQVSFTFVDHHTLHETSSCFNDDAEARGFAFDGHDFAWSLHLASLDTASESDVNVTGIAINQQNGDAYVVASVTRQFTKGKGTIAVLGKHLDKRGFAEPGARTGEDECENRGFTQEQCREVGCCKFDPGSGRCLSAVGISICHGGISQHDFSMPNDSNGNPLSDHMIHTVLMKVDKHGIPQWITYMESQFEMVANDILVDASVRPPRIMIAGIFKGYYPRLYNVNPSTKRAKRGESKERGGGIRCNDPSQIGNLAECWYFQGTPNLQTPVGSGNIEIAKPGIFIAMYNENGLATAFKGGIYFRSSGTSFPLPGTVRLAAHTTAIKTIAKNGSKVDDPSAYVDDFNGLYLSAKILVSRYRDVMYFGEQTPGYSRVGKNYGCLRQADEKGTQVLSSL
jgi:hypothetical protein